MSDLHQWPLVELISDLRVSDLHLEPLKLLGEAGPLGVVQLQVLVLNAPKEMTKILNKENICITVTVQYCTIVYSTY